MLSFLAATPPEDILYGYGPLGVVVVALAFLGNKFLNILLKDRDKAIEDRDAMLNDLLTKVFPAIVKNTEVLEKRQDLDRDLLQVIDTAHAALDRNTRVLDDVNRELNQGRTWNRSGGP